MAQAYLTTRKPPALLDGLVGGVIAAIVYTMFAQVITVATSGVDAFIIPFRQIAAVVLGEAALSPTYSVVNVAVIGTIVHLVIGALYGVILAVLANAIGLRSMLGLIVGGTVYGLAIYALNLFVIFPQLFPWFLENSAPIQASLHSLTFGAVIGAWLGRQ